MERWHLPKVCLVLVVALIAGSAMAEDIDIPYERFVLDNGLTVIVHEDHKAPIVAVNVWYHVGSKDEKVGKTGFAHLFEHLMFNGSENYDEYYRKAFDRVGATGMNGTTNVDRTNYFEVVPKTALDFALFLESDRMGHLLGAVTQDKLDQERGVVQNEKRQGENQPYGRAFSTIAEATYPAGHPYSWSTIGSMEDLNAASLEDVHEWFKAYYGTANAVLSIVGDVDTAEVKAKVERYFGDIPAGPPLNKHEVRIAPRTENTRQQMQDRVPQARVYKVWNVPEWGTKEGHYLSLMASVLSTGKTSRLYKRLVYDDQIASGVVAFAWLKELGGQFFVWVTALPGQDLSKVEAAVEEEMTRLLEEGPTAEELERVKTQYRAGFIRGIERVGGFGGKSDILAQGQVYGGSPDYYKRFLQWTEEATAADLRQVARRWLSQGAHTLEIHPFPEYQVAESTVDRSTLPQPESFPDPGFPDAERATLANGLEVILARRDAVPVVNFNLLVDAGYAADQGGKPGTAALAMGMLDEGTTSRNALEISDELSRLGANLNAGSNLDLSTVSLSALKENLDESLAVFSDVILNPSFPEADFERQRRQQLAAIQREKTTPFSMALRVFPRLMYGDGHAYSLPFTGSGTESSVSSISRQDLATFHRTWFKPNNSQLVVVGDITMGELRSRLERLLGGWQRGEVPNKNIARVELHDQPTVYLIDRPGSVQSTIFAGHVMPPKSHPDQLALDAVNQVLGGSSIARINENLRRDKHWSYGAGSALVDARGQQPFVVFAPVQTDKTKESMAEIQKEFDGILNSNPPSAEELAKVKDQQTLTLSGRWETANAVAGSIIESVRFGYDEDYWRTYADRVRGLGLPELNNAASSWLKPGSVIWVVVGDREKIEDSIRDLDLGEIRYLDADGEPLSAEAVTAAAESASAQ